jgi:hypothetical protein
MPVAISSPISSPSAFQHLLFDLPEPEPVSVIHVRVQTPASPRDLGFGILSHYCGPELIDRVLAQHGRAEQRCRLLPARLVVNAILLMCLKPTVSYQKLMYQLDGAVPPRNRGRRPAVPPSPRPVSGWAGRSWSRCSGPRPCRWPGRRWVAASGADAG